MDLIFHNKKITGILAILPEKEVRFEDEIENYNFSASQSMKLKLIMGYNKRRIADPETCVSDLCCRGLNYLFDQGKLDKEEIDAMILVTQSPDYFMPPTSNIIQGALGLKHDMICLDINQGCTGYIVGLIQAFMLLDQPAIKKVVLLNADILSRKVSGRDRNSNPLIGDGAAITIVENTKEETTIRGNIKMDGTRASALMIPAGGFRLPSSPETAVMEEDANGNFRSKDNLVMKGEDVFNFVQLEVPPLIESLLEKAAVTKEEIDYYLFHQPNRFMLQKLADKMEIPQDKMPSNIVENFGNASGVTIPTNIAYNLGDKLADKEYQVCLSGYGVGLTWASMLMQLGKLNFCEMINY